MSERRRAGRTLVPRSKPLADQAFLERDGLDQYVLPSAPWRALRILAEFVEGFDALAQVGPAISIFGSARTPRGDPFYAAAEQTGRAIAKRGFAVITGGGQQGRQGVRWPPRRLQYRATRRAGYQRLCRARRRVPLLLRAEDDVRQ